MKKLIVFALSLTFLFLTCCGEIPVTETTTQEETTEPEDIGDIDEEENNSSVTIPANSLTIIIEDGKIEVK